MRTPRLCCAHSLCIGLEEGRARECHNEGRPRTRQARRQAIRRLLIPDPPGTSPSVPVSFDKARLFRDNGARTHPRARECYSSLLVAWKAPAGVVGNRAKLVANTTQHSMQSRIGDRGGGVQEAPWLWPAYRHRGCTMDANAIDVQAQSLPEAAWRVRNPVQERPVLCVLCVLCVVSTARGSLRARRALRGTPRAALAAREPEVGCVHPGSGSVVDPSRSSSRTGRPLRTGWPVPG
jgi:hypothetical protein